MLENEILDTELQDLASQETFIDPAVFRKQSRASARRLRKVKLEESEGLSEIARFGGYGSYQPRGLHDPWVEKALELYNPNLLRDLAGYTRRGEGVVGAFKSLEKYRGPVSRFSNFSRMQRRAMISAIAKARKAFTIPVKKQPYRLHQVGQHMKTDTSAGFTFPGKRKSDVMPEIYQEARWLAHRIKNGGTARFNPKRVRFPPCVCGTRGHLSPDDDPKTRLVWVYPAEMLVIEGIFAPIIYNEIASLPNGPLMLGSSSQRLYYNWLHNFKEGEKLHGLDFSAFDTKVPPWLIHTAFDILKGCLDFEYDGNSPQSHKGKQKLSNLWSAVKWYFINTPILMPDGGLFRKRHGVPSGSYFTQLIDSVVNYILISYICEMQEIEPRDLKVLGDDSKFRSPFSLDLEKAQFDCDACNMTLKVEKCEITEDPTQFKVLGVRYKNGHLYRDTLEWFKFALYPERIPPDIGTSMSRLVGLWIGGAQLDQEFVKFFNFYQSCYRCPTSGDFSKDQKKWMEILFGGRSPQGWSTEGSADIFWKSLFFIFG